jgi:hypothetical protein
MGEDRADPRNWTPAELATALLNAIRLRDFRAVDEVRMLLALRDGPEAEWASKMLTLAASLADALRPDWEIAP